MPRPPLAPALAAVALIAAACAGASASPSPAAPSVTASSVPPPTPVATPLPASATVAPTRDETASQTETGWGRIWDALPAEFPTVSPGPVVEAAPDQPASGAFDVDAPVDEVAAAMQAALELGDFSTLSLAGPLADGSVVIESVGPESTDCLVQTTIAPRDDGSRITILYGAACPVPLE
jgi:hypothetical protein